MEDLTGIAAALWAVAQVHWPWALGSARVEAGSLTLALPAPSGRASLYLTADIDFDEMIVGFGGGHSHGGPWDRPGDPDFELAGTITFVAAIMAEEVVGVRLPGGGGAIGPLDWVARQAWSPETTTIHSWLGTHDRGPGLPH